MRAQRVLGIWIAIAALAGVVAAATSPDPDAHVEASGPYSPTHRPTAADGVEPTTTASTVPTTTTTTATMPVTSTTATAVPPRPAALHIEEPGLWIIRRDGSAARFLGDERGGVGSGITRTGYDLAWGPDSASMYLLTEYDGVDGRFTRMGLDGSLTRYDLPPSPPIGADVPPAPRRMTGFSIVGNHVTFSWRRDDGFAGASISTMDLTRIVELDDDHYCCDALASPRGDQVAFSQPGRLDVLDLAGRKVASVSFPDGGGASGRPAWSRDGTRIVLGGCVVEIRSGACVDHVDARGRAVVEWTRDGAQLLWWRFGAGAEPNAVSIGGPSGPERVVARYGHHPILDPLADRVIVADNPYQDELPGPASLHAVALDGSSDRVLATTRNAIAVPWGWSPDGQWLAVHLGGPRG